MTSRIHTYTTTFLSHKPTFQTSSKRHEENIVVWVCAPPPPPPSARAAQQSWEWWVEGGCRRRPSGELAASSLCPHLAEGVESPYEVKGIFPEEKESVRSRAGWPRDSPFPQNSGQQIFTKNLLNYLLNYPSEDLTNNPTVYKDDCFIRFSPKLSIKTVFHLCHIS